MVQASAYGKASATERRGSSDRFAIVLARARADSFEFPPFLANHLPMILVALDQLGATQDQLEAYDRGYRAAQTLVPVTIPARGRIHRDNWRDHLGERSFEGDYRAYFADEVGRLGSKRAQEAYLPDLAPGVAASALHALMRLAYADLTGDASETAVALAYWASTFLPLGEADAATDPTEEPEDILLRLRARLTGPPPRPESDLLWHWMRAVAAHPAFRGVPGSLTVTPGTLTRLRRTSLALMASTMTFEAVHALTGCHWLRLVAPSCPVMPVLLSAFWTAIAAVYPKIGMPLLLDEAALAAMRQTPHLPDWSEIAAVTVTRADEHDVSLAFSARAEWSLTHDRLYQVIAARRLGLI